MTEEDVTRERVPPEAAVPPVNTLLRIRILTEQSEDGSSAPVEASSRVEDTTTVPGRDPLGSEIVIAAPRFSGDVNQPHPEAPCLVTWLTQRGIHELPTAYLGTTTLGGSLRTWRLRVTGPAYRVQRRRFFRVPCSFPVVLRPIPPGDDDRTSASQAPTRPALGRVTRPWSPSGPGRTAAAHTTTPVRDTEQPESQALIGHTIDLSEGGARCAVRGPLLESGSKIRLSMHVDERVIEATAMVIRADPGDPGQPDLYELSLCFEDPDASGDTLRRIVFAEQLRSRRLGG